MRVRVPSMGSLRKSYCCGFSNVDWLRFPDSPELYCWRKGSIVAPAPSTTQVAFFSDSDGTLA